MDVKTLLTLSLQTSLSVEPAGSGGGVGDLPVSSGLSLKADMTLARGGGGVIMSSQPFHQAPPEYLLSTIHISASA
jgi:hypothetical protein